MVPNLFIDLSESEFLEACSRQSAESPDHECKLGDELIFRVDGRPVAKAIVSRIEHFEGFRVFWQPHTFATIQ
jgi:hypothetical protein